jgi:flagellar biosynthesis protein FlhA
VSIRNLVSVLEILADYSPMTKDVSVLTEYVRAGLARQICLQHQMPDGSLPVITLDPQLEESVLNSVQQAEGASYPVLAPDVMQRFNSSLSGCIEKSLSLNYTPIVMCSPRVRMYVRRLVERMFPSLVVLSHSEVIPETRVKAVSQVQV